MTHHSPVVSLLIRVSEELPRVHVSAIPASRVHLARTDKGYGDSPTSRYAALWSLTGYVIKLDPVEYPHPRWPDAGHTGEQALDCLERAAWAMGYLTVNHVDQAGVLGVVKCCKRAIQLAEMDEPEPRKVSAGSYGSNPRGVSA